jgi:hypothetical protein
MQRDDREAWVIAIDVRGLGGPRHCDGPPASSQPRQLQTPGATGPGTCEAHALVDPHARRPPTQPGAAGAGWCEPRRQRGAPPTAPAPPPPPAAPARRPLCAHCVLPWPAHSAEPLQAASPPSLSTCCAASRARGRLRARPLPRSGRASTHTATTDAPPVKPKRCRPLCTPGWTGRTCTPTMHRHPCVMLNHTCTQRHQCCTADQLGALPRLPPLRRHRTHGSTRHPWTPHPWLHTHPNDTPRSINTNPPPPHVQPHQWHHRCAMHRFQPRTDPCRPTCRPG